MSKRELKCPKCGTTFSVDEADYAAIVSQVKSIEFQIEVDRRMEELHRRNSAEQKLVLEKNQREFQEKLNSKELEINKKDGEISQLKQQLNSLSQAKDLEFVKRLTEKDKTIEGLKSQINQSEDRLQIALLEERQKSVKEIQNKQSEINELIVKSEAQKSESLKSEAMLKEQYEIRLKQANELIDYYKDMKSKQSTKMIGESLEVHCSTEFNRVRPLFPNAYFEKDNDIAQGSKGDFIFRDFEDGVEYVSIMFEMKNEADETQTKHKNEDFLKKLDQDRRNKGCEFAVLVSLLEQDSELYNTGIVDMSHRYEKMYVIRPQFFIPIITLLVQTSKKSLDYKKQLEIAKRQSIDVTNFENELSDFKDKFAYNYRLASKKFQNAIDEIDKTISHLQTVRKELVGSEDNLRLANDKAEKLTIKKLTKNSPSLRDKFKGE
ncbi:MAG: DUF2130 domain-containing protein [Bacteroidales bacterium]|nr:DUF2130 domain-containing protein [Bacteroidales bacterium]